MAGPVRKAGEIFTGNDPVKSTISGIHDGVMTSLDPRQAAVDVSLDLAEAGTAGVDFDRFTTNVGLGGHYVQHKDPMRTVSKERTRAVINAGREGAIKAGLGKAMQGAATKVGGGALTTLVAPAVVTHYGVKGLNDATEAFTGKRIQQHITDYNMATAKPGSEYHEKFVKPTQPYKPKPSAAPDVKVSVEEGPAVQAHLEEFEKQQWRDRANRRVEEARVRRENAKRKASPLGLGFLGL